MENENGDNNNNSDKTICEKIKYAHGLTNLMKTSK